MDCIVLSFIYALFCCEYDNYYHNDIVVCDANCDGSEDEIAECVLNFCSYCYGNAVVGITCSKQLSEERIAVC